MKAWTNKLQEAIAAASQPGELLEPVGLLAACARQDNPVAALTTEESSHDLFSALGPDLRFDWAVRAAQVPLTDEQRTRLAGAIRWLLAAIRTWRLDADPKRARLTAILTLSAWLDDSGTLLRMLPDGPEQNSALGQVIAEIIGKIQLVLQTGPGSHTPISDRERLDQFAASEAQQDWKTLRELTENQNFHFLSNTVVRQGTRILDRYFPDALGVAGRAVSSVSVAMQMVSALGSEGAFRFATACANGYVQFAAVSRLFNRYDLIHALTEAEDAALTDLLCLVARDPAQWTKWMQAFASYPHSASMMQTALGRCLAVSEDAAFRAYMDALLISVGLGRAEVAACLKAFAEGASRDRRERAWRLAFERWSRWNYGEGEPGNPGINEISQSNLDFAIVGYAIECLTADEREAFIDECRRTVGGAEDIWHKSQTDMMHYVWRALSRIQPFARARTCGDDRGGWLWENQGYFLTDLNTPFWIKRFGLFKMAEEGARAAPAALA